MTETTLCGRTPHYPLQNNVVLDPFCMYYESIYETFSSVLVLYLYIYPLSCTEHHHLPSVQLRTSLNEMPSDEYTRGLI